MLHYACMNIKELVPFLLKYEKIKKDIKCNDYHHNTALDLACNNPTIDEETADHLIANGRLTPLHYACITENNNKKIDVIKLLITKGADVNAKGGMWGDVPIYYASDNAVIALLLVNGADSKGMTVSRFEKFSQLSRRSTSPSLQSA